MALASLYASLWGEAPLLFYAGKRCLYLSAWACEGCGRYHSLMLAQRDATCWVNSRLHSLVFHVQVLGSPLSCDFKNEVLSIQQLEAKKSSACCALINSYAFSQRTHSSAVNSISNAEVRVAKPTGAKLKQKNHQKCHSSMSKLSIAKASDQSCSGACVQFQAASLG